MRVVSTHNVNNVSVPSIGEVYMMNFTGDGSEQRGWRPGLVFQNNIGNKYSPNIIALPLTSSIKKSSQPTHVTLKARDTGLRFDSMVLCENPKTISKHKIGQYLTSLPNEYMKQVAEAQILASSAISFLSKEDVLGVWQKAAEFNCTS